MYVKRLILIEIEISKLCLLFQEAVYFIKILITLNFLQYHAKFNWISHPGLMKTENTENIYNSNQQPTQDITVLCSMLECVGVIPLLIYTMLRWKNLLFIISGILKQLL